MNRKEKKENVMKTEKNKENETLFMSLITHHSLTHIDTHQNLHSKYLKQIE